MRNFLKGITLTLSIFCVVSIAFAQFGGILQITEMELTGTLWETGREGGSVDAKMRFAPGGVVEGGAIYGLSRWAVDGAAVVLSDQSGQPQARISEFGKDAGGKWLLRGMHLHAGIIALKEGQGYGLTNTSASGVLSITNYELTETVWNFGRADGSQIARIKLVPGGRIDGYSHPNEAKWGVEGNTVVFYGTNGAVTTRFTSFEKSGNHWLISGAFLPDSRITHILSDTVIPQSYTTPVSQPQAMPSSIASGVWNTSEGTMTLKQNGTQVNGSYTQDGGEITGVMDGSTLNGYWIENGSNRRCDRPMNGRFFWGRFVAHFTDRAFAAKWGYCDDAPTAQWNGTRQ